MQKKKVCVLVAAVLLSVSAALAATSIGSTSNTTPEWQDYIANPYEKDFEGTKTSLTSAWEELEKLYSSFDFDALISAYYKYVKIHASYEALKKKYDAFEKKVPHKVAIRVMGVDMTANARWQKLDVNGEPVNDKALHSSFGSRAQPLAGAEVAVGKAISLKILFLSINRFKAKKTFKSNENGWVFLRRLPTMKLGLRVRADGHLQNIQSFKVTRSIKKYVFLEKLSASVAGVVRGLPKIPNTIGFRRPGKPLGLLRAKLVFKHSSGRTYTTASTDAKHVPNVPSWPKDLKKENGIYFSRRMLEGSYEVTVAYKGYRSFKGKMDLANGLTPKVQNFVLLPEMECPVATNEGEGTTSGTTANVSSSNLNDPLAR